MLDKFGSRGLVVLVVNVTREQDDQVLPFLKDNHYSFVPLKGTREMIGTYAIRSVPTEYVIDREGRAVADVRLNSGLAEHLFENLMEHLLPAAKTTP